MLKSVRNAGNDIFIAKTLDAIADMLKRKHLVK